VKYGGQLKGISNNSNGAGNNSLEENVNFEWCFYECFALLLMVNRI
jgi:hypothetical protein